MEKWTFKKGNLEPTVKLKQGRESTCACVCVNIYTLGVRESLKNDSWSVCGMTIQTTVFNGQQSQPLHSIPLCKTC